MGESWRRGEIYGVCRGQYTQISFVIRSGTDLAGGVGGATSPPKVLCPSVNFVSFGKNHLLVVSRNKFMPKFYLSIHYIFF